MKILLVAHSFPRHRDDMAGAFLLDLARGQQRLGHEVAAVVPHAAGLALRETIDGVDVHRFRYGTDAEETLAYTGTMADQVLRSWRARWRLVHYLRALRASVRTVAAAWHPDVVHVHWWFPGGLAVWPGAAALPPVVMTSHGTDLFLADRLAPMRALARRVFGAARAVTVISTPLVARAESLGVARSRITICPMPVGMAAPEGGALKVPGRLLFVGRLTERKGATYALDAVALLRRAGRDVSLVVVGDGAERAALERHAGELGIAAHVAFRGALPPAAVTAEYAAAQAFVMPAITDWKGEQEGFGLVLVEAMLAGLPVIASRSGGIPDVVRDGETGWLVGERDVPTLAAAIAQVLDDPAAAARIADAGRRDAAARFSPDGIARSFDRVYRSVTGAAA